jgi:hypothetical protein
MPRYGRTDQIFYSSIVCSAYVSSGNGLSCLHSFCIVSREYVYVFSLDAFSSQLQVPLSPYEQETQLQQEKQSQIDWNPTNRMPLE